MAWNDNQANFTDNSYAYKKAGEADLSSIENDVSSKDPMSGNYRKRTEQWNVAGNEMSNNLKGMKKQYGILPDGYNMHTGFSKFGYMDPNGRVLDGKEVLFFTRPDLHIMDDDGNLNKDINKNPFFLDLLEKRPNVIKDLQISYNPGGAIDSNNKCIYALHNRVRSNLDLSDATAIDIDLPANMYGNDYTYRGTSEAADDKPAFSLDFEDTKDTDLYYFFKAYDEYERLKSLGRLAPPGQWVSEVLTTQTAASQYVQKRIIHDQIAIYKFIISEDLETILFYAKIYGVYPKTVPRSSFNNTEFASNGLSLSIDWNGAFVEDTNPLVLSDFNELMSAYKNMPNLSSVNSYGGTDRSWARGAYIVEEPIHHGSTIVKPKLKWRGDI